MFCSYQKLITGLSFLLIALCYLKVTVHFEKVAESDPDRYLHLALAKITAESGRIESLPQVENLGWNNKFIEKNYLFTLLTSIAFRFQGETGVIFLARIFTLLVALFFLLNLNSTSLGNAALFLALIPLASDDFASRISLLRPHVLALPLFLLLVYSVRMRNRLLCGLACFLYTLSYHALYVPLSFLTISAIFFEQKPLRKTIGAGVFGILTGILLNPYFPSQLFSTRNSFRMALNLSGVPEADRPIEILPIATDDFVMQFGFYLFLLFFCWFQCRQINETSENELSRTNFKILLFSSSFFWVLGIYSRRAFEYAIPLSLILFTALLPLIKNYYRVFASLTLFALALNLKPAFELYARPILASYEVSQVLEAVQTIPETLHAKVFNCEWANGPFILYKRPRLHFVDLTDPVLLNDYAPKDYALRNKLKEGQINDVYELINQHFKSDYVLCDHPNIITRMENDPRFQRLYPNLTILEGAKSPGFTTLYAIRK